MFHLLLYHIATLSLHPQKKKKKKSTVFAFVGLQRTEPQKTKQKPEQVSEICWLRSPDTTEPNRLESNYKNMHQVFVLKKAQDYFIFPFGNRNPWDSAYFVIYLYV